MSVSGTHVNVSAKDVYGATLLSVGEASQIPRDILTKVSDSWWLSSPGWEDHLACFVDENGLLNGCGEHVDVNLEVRPALLLSGGFKVSDGDKFMFDGKDYTVVCNGKYALCDESLKSAQFNSYPDLRDKLVGNAYDDSDIRYELNGWYSRAFARQFGECCKDYYSEEVYKILKEESLMSIALSVGIMASDTGNPVYKHAIDTINAFDNPTRDLIVDELYAAIRIYEKVNKMSKSNEMSDSADNEQDFFVDVPYIPDEDLSF